MSFVDEEIVV